jgi:hypothetical protein
MDEDVVAEFDGRGCYMVCSWEAPVVSGHPVQLLRDGSCPQLRKCYCGSRKAFGKSAVEQM